MSRPVIQQLPPPPRRGEDFQTFTAKANVHLAALTPWTNDVNAAGAYIETTAAEVEADRLAAEAAATSAEDAEAIALSSANFKGSWKDLAGSLAVPSSVYHNDSYWQLLNDLADVTTSEPGVSSAWAPIRLMPDIRRPIPVSPKDGDVGVGLSATFSASTYAPLYSASARSYREFQIAEASQPGWDTLVAYSQVDSDSFTPEQLLPLEMQLKWRCRDVSESGEASEWMLTQIFTTTNQFINQPSIISPQDSSTNIPEQPILESSPFATTPPGSDSHSSTSWRLRDSLGDVVWSSISDTQNLTAITIPAGVLVPAETYQAEVRHEGGVLADSAWSVPVGFTTSDIFVPEDGAEGEPFGGGFFTARMKDENGAWYALVMSPAAEGQNNGNTMTWQDAMNYAAGLTIGGHNDWKLMTRDEARVAYRKFKPDTASNDISYGATDKVEPPLGNYTSSNPSQTSLAAWRTGGAEAFFANHYWTADESGSSAYRVHFDVGGEYLGTKTFSSYVRAVRRVYF